MTETPKIKVAVVEDWDELRSTLGELLGAASDMKYLGACANGEEALRKIPNLQPNVVLMDIELPKMDGIQCVRELKELLPTTEFMMLTIFDDYKNIFDALLFGATGYLVKKTPPEALLSAIRELHAGGSPMSPLIARKVILTLRQLGDASDPLQNLTKRESEVLQLLASGMIYKEIADQIGLAESTIRGHLHKIYEKLHVRNRQEATRLYNKAIKQQAGSNEET